MRLNIKFPHVVKVTVKLLRLFLFRINFELSTIHSAYFENICKIVLITIDPILVTPYALSNRVPFTDLITLFYCANFHAPKTPFGNFPTVSRYNLRQNCTLRRPLSLRDWRSRLPVSAPFPQVLKKIFCNF